MFCPFGAGHELPFGNVKIVIFIPRGDVQVVMPNILISGRFIMLPRRNPIARITFFIAIAKRLATR
jgi:hypothetical protein